MKKAIETPAPKRAKRVKAPEPAPELPVAELPREEPKPTPKRAKRAKLPEPALVLPAAAGKPASKPPKRAKIAEPVAAAPPREEPKPIPKSPKRAKASKPTSDPVALPRVEPWQTEEWLARVHEFAASLGFGPEHSELTIRTFTHRSIGEEAALGDNERLEFLGDTVLAVIVCEHLYRTYPKHTEGQLTKLKQRYVSEPSLAEAAAALGLGTLLAMAAGDELAGGRDRPSTLCDTFEAVLAALYLARGLEAAREFLRVRLIERVDPTVLWDHKSRLQELYQEKHGPTPFYRTAPSGGPAHAPIFRSEVIAAVDLTEGAPEQFLGEGTGRSKKVAEQNAAEDALARIEKPKRKSRKKATPAEAPTE